MFPAGLWWDASSVLSLIFYMPIHHPDLHTPTLCLASYKAHFSYEHWLYMLIVIFSIVWCSDNYWRCWFDAAVSHCKDLCMSVLCSESWTATCSLILHDSFHSSALSRLLICTPKTSIASSITLYNEQQIAHLHCPTMLSSTLLLSPSSCRHRWIPGEMNERQFWRWHSPELDLKLEELKMNKRGDSTDPWVIPG